MTWRERLQAQRAAIFPKSPDALLTKPTKLGSVSFGSTPDGHSENIAEPIEAVSTTVDTRAALLALADRLGVDRSIVASIPSADLSRWASVPAGALLAFLRGLDAATTRQAGKVPQSDTAAIHCAHCGPVFVHPAVAAVLPVVDGWPRAIGCPWCAIRKAGGYVPQPVA